MITSNNFKKLEHVHAQSGRHNFDRIERRIRLAVLKAAHIGLIETASLGKDYLGISLLRT